MGGLWRLVRLMRVKFELYLWPWFEKYMGICRSFFLEGRGLSQPGRSAWADRLWIFQATTDAFVERTDI